MKGLREAAIRASRMLMPRELWRKRAVVAYYNTTAAFWRFGRSAEWGPSILDADGVVLSDNYRLDEEYRGNCLYGIARALRRYASADGKLRACIEHGVYFGDYVNADESVRSGLPAVITFSDVRRERIHALSPKTTFTVGPYISYAQEYLDEERAARLKSQLGRTLLVFPSHSHDRESVHFNIDAFVREVERCRQAGSFDSVVCCMYYWDLRMGRATHYANTDYVLTCAGHRYDPHFLSRLKTLIGLSDQTLSNSVGTHIGYSVALGKPHLLIQQEVHWGEEKPAVPRPSGSADTRQTEIDDVHAAFCHASEAITERQRLVCERYWGLNRVRSPDEMRFIIDVCEEVFRSTLGREALFEDAFRRVLEDVTCPAQAATLRDAMCHA